MESMIVYYFLIFSTGIYFIYYKNLKNSFKKIIELELKIKNNRTLFLKNLYYFTSDIASVHNGNVFFLTRKRKKKRNSEKIKNFIKIELNN